MLFRACIRDRADLWRESTGEMAGKRQSLRVDAPKDPKTNHGVFLTFVLHDRFGREPPFVGSVKVKL